MSAPVPGLASARPDQAALDPATFTELFRGHPAGVAVVTLHDGGRPAGFTATSVISVSADPAVVAFSVSSTSSCWPALTRADRVAINLLAEEQRDLAATFATPGVDRFADADWHRLPTGEPVLVGTAGWISGRITARVEAGSSHLVVVAASSASVAPREPLVYRNRGYHRLIEYEI
ncbi:flavin reductase family protein [Desertihabitans aurantiacus]|uniref:flavin reductase family protein n=1 Tax=Desertihabitans aurantiacus TaxID=2282477 RepID=UPI0018E5009E|nr:flavin reductase family protein [Desertihabitans aurantiacus]